MPKEVLFNIMTTKDSLACIFDVTKAPLAVRSFRGQGYENASTSTLTMTGETRIEGTLYWTLTSYERALTRGFSSEGLPHPPGPQNPVCMPPSPYLRKKLIIHVKSRAHPIVGVDEREARAIETLREMISEADYRRYIKYGFILVRGHSRAIYQIFRESSHTKVWLNGQVIEEICVRIKDHAIPPTDNVIAFKVLVETSEELFRKQGNVYNMRKAVA